MKPKTVQEFFQVLPGKLDADAAEGVTAVYQFDLSGPQGGQYHVQIQDGTCVVQEGTHPDPHVTLAMAGDDCLRILSGELHGASVAMSGRLRVSGDLGLAIQLTSLFPTIRA
ncbi:MAG: SCP2 sterol-binding domain-containing protein [Nitrospiraceae bacterium]